MEEFTISLALEDYVTVIFFGIGLYFLWQMTAHKHPPASQLVAIGGAMITLGGASKATWKLIIAASGTDIWLMDNIHFILMTPGYILLAAGILATLRRERDLAAGQKRWLVPLVLIVLTLAGSLYLSLTQEGRAWFFMLLGITTLANVIVSGALVRFTWASGLRLAAGLFIVNIVLIFVLAGMAQSLERTLTNQWIEQITNNISFGAFAAASWMTNQFVQRSEPHA